MSTKPKGVPVFVVMADFDHECSYALRSFLLKPTAVAFQNACWSHEAQKPECPPVESTPENDRLWERYDRAMKRWKKHHPLGLDADTSGAIYCIVEIELW